MSKPDLTKILCEQFRECRNPGDLKPSIIGVVKQLDPVIVSINNGSIFLTEGEELFISEWFRFRCNIDKTGALSETVPNDVQSAKNVTETHSYTGSPCSIPNAISSLANAITEINNEFLALKCVLNIDDNVVICSLEQTDKYLLFDKVI